jgi:hypothetical protein
VKKSVMFHFLLQKWCTELLYSPPLSLHVAFVFVYTTLAHTNVSHLQTSVLCVSFSSSYTLPVSVSVSYETNVSPSYIHSTCQQLALGPTQPPVQWLPEALSLGVKRLGCDADHSPPPNAKVKNSWSYTSTPPIRLHGVVLS